MSLVDKDHMTELRSAADALETSLTAAEDIQMQSVAFAINQASNTGETKVMFQTELLKGVEQQLLNNGYKVNQPKGVDDKNQVVISWAP